MSGKTGTLSEIRCFLESRVFLPESHSAIEEMAEFTQFAVFYCSNNHVPTETVSTDRYKLLCRTHVPVYLFVDARDDMFLTYHYHVGI